MGVGFSASGIWKGSSGVPPGPRLSCWCQGWAPQTAVSERLLSTSAGPPQRHLLPLHQRRQALGRHSRQRARLPDNHMGLLLGVGMSQPLPPAFLCSACHRDPQKKESCRSGGTEAGAGRQGEGRGSQGRLSYCPKACWDDITLVNFPWVILGSLSPETWFVGGPQADWVEGGQLTLTQLGDPEK